MNGIYVVDARTGETLPGIPTPRLMSVGAGEAYFVPSGEAGRLYIEHRDTETHTGEVYVEGCPTCDSEVELTGVWYLHVPGQYVSPTGDYSQVRIKVVDTYPGW